VTRNGANCAAQAQDDRIRDRRLPPFAWQEKEALRLMRDFFAGEALAELRTTYLAFTEIVSDHPEWGHEINSANLPAGQDSIADYAGLSYKTYIQARCTLESLGLISTQELRNKRGHRAGTLIRLLPSPIRPERSAHPHRLHVLNDAEATTKLLEEAMGSQLRLTVSAPVRRSAMQKPGLQTIPLEEETGSELRLTVSGPAGPETPHTEEQDQRQKTSQSQKQRCSGTDVPGRGPRTATAEDLPSGGVNPSSAGDVETPSEPKPPETPREYAAAIIGRLRSMPGFGFLQDVHGFDLAANIGKIIYRGFNGSGGVGLERPALERLWQSVQAAQDVPTPPEQGSRAWGWMQYRIEAICESDGEVPPFDFCWTHPARDGRTWREVLCPEPVVSQLQERP